MAQIYYYDPQSAGINMQSHQSESTPRRITLYKVHKIRTFLWHHSGRYIHFVSTKKNNRNSLVGYRHSSENVVFKGMKKPQI